MKRFTTESQSLVRQMTYRSGLCQTRREFTKTVTIGVVAIAIGGWKGCQGDISDGSSQRYLQSILGELEAASLIELATIAVPDFHDCVQYFAIVFRDIAANNSEFFTARTNQYHDFLGGLSRPIDSALEQSLSADKSGVYARIVKPDIVAGFLADPIWRGQMLHAPYSVWSVMGFDPIFKPSKCSQSDLQTLAQHLVRPPDRMSAASRSNLPERAHHYCEMKT